MSMENVRKLLYQEWDLDPYELRITMMVADWTGDDGKGFACSTKTIAARLHMSGRTVKNKLKSLREKGFLEYGNQRLVEDYAPNRRPKVYNLHFPKRVGARRAPQKMTGENRGAYHAPQETDVHLGCTCGESGVNLGCTQYAHNTINTPNTINTIERDARARKQIPRPADWKPTEEHQALADRLGIDCDVEAGKFKDRALDTGATSADWDAKFRIWLMRGHELGYTTVKNQQSARKYTWASDEVKRVIGTELEGTDDYMELACKVADLLNQGLDPDMLRRQLANVPGDVLAEQLFEQEAAA